MWAINFKENYLKNFTAQAIDTPFQMEMAETTWE